MIQDVRDVPTLILDQPKIAALNFKEPEIEDTT